MGDVFGLLGQPLDGKYEVLSVVGEGGFGVVYRAQHRALKTPVALKVLKIPADFSENAQREFAKKFLEEAQTVARLQHPAVVRALDFGVSVMPVGTNAPWTVLEWVDGQTLGEWLTARGGRPCAPREVLGLVRPVLEALAVAHAQGIAHRDIKPANVMVLAPQAGPAQSLQGYLPATRVLDFGIAKAMQPGETDAPSGATRTASTLMAFSLQYAAPEQLSGMRTGPWTDVHALGLVLTEMLVGRRPYQGEDKMALSMAVLSPRRPTPAAFGVDAGAWEPVLARALAIHPSERFANAAELLAALDAASQQPALTPAIVAPTVVMAPPAGAALGAHPAPAPSVAPVRSGSRGVVAVASVGAMLFIALVVYGLLSRSVTGARTPAADASSTVMNNPPIVPPLVPPVQFPMMSSEPSEATPTLSSPPPLSPSPPEGARREGGRRNPPMKRAPRQVGGVPLGEL
jgi:serine/threonine protein kinase